VNTEWMRERLEHFEELCKAYHVELNLSGDGSERMSEINKEITFEMPTIRQIVSRLDPALSREIVSPDYLSGTWRSLHAVREALGHLRDRELWKANLEPDAPSLIADRFHPYVWEAAESIWETGKYRVAVQQSATALSAHIAQKACSNLMERALVAQVFAKDDPKPGMARLHMPGDKTSETWRSRQEGLHLLAQGAFAGIRNVATHTADEWTEQEALEKLAVLSVVARWVDETELVSNTIEN
jgi:Protein of unknown function (Hypoth_ymh)